MLTLGSRIRLVAFAMLAVLIMAFTAVKYANLGRYIGLSGYYTVRMYLPNAGGLYPSADVEYRGVSVGRVAAMGLTSDGIYVDLAISNAAPKIPANLQATVADLSAVGEEYVNLRPQTDSGPYLTGDSVIAQHNTQVPQPITALLSSVNTLVTSVPRQSLRTVVNELGNAFADQGPNLQVLLDTSSSLTQAASENIPQTTRLINDGQTVLATQQAESSELESFGVSANLLAGQLVNSDSDLRGLITAAPQAAEQVSGLLQDNNLTLGAVIANLLTTSNVTLTRQSALEEILSALPAAVAAGSTVINSSGANFGLALTFFNPLPCFSGYGSTEYRNGLDLSPPRVPFNTSVSCNLPASSNVDVRGSAHSPTAGVAVPPVTANGSDTTAGLGVSTSGSGALPSGLTGMSQLLGLAP
jgi:phospholipid/cholesterol/gamma-HCH transport system substrate-binding protein